MHFPFFVKYSFCSWLLLLAGPPISYTSPVDSLKIRSVESSLSPLTSKVQQDINAVSALTEYGATLGEGQEQNATAFALTVSRPSIPALL